MEKEECRLENKNAEWKMEREKWKIENNKSLTNLCSGRPSQPDVFFCQQVKGM